MKKLFLFLVLTGTAFMPMANAGMITFHTVTTDELDFTVIWGPSPDYHVGLKSDPVINPFGDLVSAGVGIELGKTDQYHTYYDKIDLSVINPVWGTGGTADGIFIFPPSDFALADALSVGFFSLMAQPTSMTPTPDGYGARFVFDRVPPDSSSSVPDGGSSMAMVGLSAVACLGLRKVLSR